MYPSHSTGFVHVRHTALGQFTAGPLQFFAAFSSSPPPVGVHLLLLVLFPFPVPWASVRLRYVTTAAYRMYVLQYGSAVVTLVGHHLFDAPQVDLRLFCRSRRHLVLDQLRYRIARLCHSLVNRCRFALIRSLHSNRQQSAAWLVHLLLHFVDLIGAA